MTEKFVELDEVTENAGSGIEGLGNNNRGQCGTHKK